MKPDERTAVGENKKSEKHENKKGIRQKSQVEKPKRPKDDKPKKQARKQAKRAALEGRTCPCCKKHCPLADPKCSKGKAVRTKLLRDAGLAKN